VLGLDSFNSICLPFFFLKKKKKQYLIKMIQAWVILLKPIQKNIEMFEMNITEFIKQINKIKMLVSMIFELN